eukprot:7418129-Pyramimonas_sp.AAC.1
MVSGGTWDWEFAHPNALPARLARECPRLHDVFAKAACAHPCSPSAPWNLTVGFDEFFLGDPRSPDQTKKAMQLSFSFVELGQEALWHETAW